MMRWWCSIVTMLVQHCRQRANIKKHRFNFFKYFCLFIFGLDDALMVQHCINVAPTLKLLVQHFANAVPAHCVDCTPCRTSAPVDGGGGHRLRKQVNVPVSARIEGNHHFKGSTGYYTSRPSGVLTRALVTWWGHPFIIRRFFPGHLAQGCLTSLLSLRYTRGGGPRVVVSTAAFHARVRGSVVGSLRDREVACSASDRQGLNFESCVWRTVSSQSSHHPQEVLLAQFSLYVHKGGLKPDSFLLFRYTRHFNNGTRRSEGQCHLIHLTILLAQFSLLCAQRWPKTPFFSFHLLDCEDARFSYYTTCEQVYCWTYFHFSFIQIHPLTLTSIAMRGLDVINSSGDDSHRAVGDLWLPVPLKILALNPEDTDVDYSIHSVFLLAPV